MILIILAFLLPEILADSSEMQCAGSFGQKVGDPVCCAEAATLTSAATICGEDRPTCVGYRHGTDWGRCIEHKCASDFGGDQWSCGESLPHCIGFLENKDWGECRGCAHNFGESGSWQCPGSAPRCDGFVHGEVWGTCMPPKDTGKCASEKRWWSLFDDPKCECDGGWVKIGKNGVFSDWIQIDGNAIDCDTRDLGVDPLPEVRKDCYCGSLDAAEETVEEALSDVELQSFVAKLFQNQLPLVGIFAMIGVLTTIFTMLRVFFPQSKYEEIAEDDV